MDKSLLCLGISLCCLFTNPIFSQCDNDQTFPTINCLNGISMNLAPNGMLNLKAQEIDAGSTDNCTATENLIFSFSQDTNNQTRLITCEDLGTIDLEIWVTDEAGNQDFCTAFIGIEDVFNACGGGGATGNFLSGCVTTTDGVPVEGVDIQLFVDPLTDPLLETQVEGCYNLQLPEGDNISGRIGGKKEGRASNGVSTFDAVLIRKHILTIDLLDNPYKIIAADVNNSGSVSTFDLVVIRKVILGIEPAFPNTPNWRFIPANHEFADPTNPFEGGFPEQIEFMTGINTVDFIAIKTGDVNGNADVGGE